ncbi:MAG: ankyrin repeat domain-containing protein [Actinomycetota bacterium]|nr:ankyrin repeat domain-containing protein [Actinomycetota bacterium]
MPASLTGGLLGKARDSDGWSPLFAAAQSGPPEAVRVLLGAGADPCATTSASWAKGLRPSQVTHLRSNERVTPILEAAERARCDRPPDAGR